MGNYYKKVDANQSEIVQKLRRLGISVKSVATIGQGFPDLVVGYHGQNYLIELKDEGKSPSQRKLTDQEMKFQMGWRGQVDTCKSLQEILDVLDIKLTKPIRGGMG